MSTQIKLLYDEQQIRNRVKELAKIIKKDYIDDKPILCVCVLRGAVMFFTDLVKEIGGDKIMFDFIRLSSYGSGTESSGKVSLLYDIKENPEGKHLLIIEDIVDSGFTLKFLKEYFMSKNPIDIKVACLLDKPMTRKVQAEADYTAFVLQRPSFIVGYGLDWAEKYRNYNGIFEVIQDEN